MGLQRHDDLDLVSRFLISAISVLDEHGAWNWNLYQLAFGTFLLLGAVRWILQRKRGVEWYACLHALLSAWGSAACLYLDIRASATMSGIQEPLRAVLCHGPLTSLHRILPAVTMAYSVFDLIDGISISPDFVMHGVATMAVTVFFLQMDAPHVLAPMLFMEGSTAFLTLVNADFFPPIIAQLNQVCFVVSFFLCRLVVVPWCWMNLMLTMWENRLNDVFVDCYPPIFKYACFFFGMFYNVLNAYWFKKILSKARRRIQGVEKHYENNDLYRKKTT